jgi:hypothetical protein
MSGTQDPPAFPAPSLPRCLYSGPALLCYWLCAGSIDPARWLCIPEVWSSRMSKHATCKSLGCKNSGLRQIWPLPLPYDDSANPLLWLLPLRQPLLQILTTRARSDFGFQKKRILTRGSVSGWPCRLAAIQTTQHQELHLEFLLLSLSTP